MNLLCYTWCQNWAIVQTSLRRIVKVFFIKRDGATAPVHIKGQGTLMSLVQSRTCSLIELLDMHVQFTEASYRLFRTIIYERSMPAFDSKKLDQGKHLLVLHSTTWSKIYFCVNSKNFKCKSITLIYRQSFPTNSW